MCAIGVGICGGQPSTARVKGLRWLMGHHEKGFKYESECRRMKEGASHRVKQENRPHHNITIMPHLCPRLFTCYWLWSGGSRFL